MRDHFLLLAIPLAMLWGLTSAVRGTLVLLAICFIRPQAFSWGMWSTLPTFKIALAIAILSGLWHGGLRFKFPPFLAAFWFFLAWSAFTCFFGFNTATSWSFYTAYLLQFWVVSFYLFAAIHSLKTWKYALWVSAGSLGFLAAKTGMALTLHGGGHVTKQINGFVGDNNVFGLTLCLALACIMGLRGTIGHPKFRLAFYPVMAMMIMCIVYTESRGAFLTIAVIFLLSAVLSRHRIRNTLVLLVVASLAICVIPDRFFNRMQTFEDIQADDSAMSRVFFWKLSWVEATEHPITGIGLDNDLAYNDAFFSAELNGRTNHVSHSVYFQILSQTGFFGLALYLCLCSWTLYALQRARRHALVLTSAYPDLRWTAQASYWMRNAFIGYLFGSAFLNMLVYDFPWYFIFFSQMLAPLLDAEVVRRKQRARVRKAAAAD